MLIVLLLLLAMAYAHNDNIPPQFQPPSYLSTIITPAYYQIYPFQFIGVHQPSIQTFLIYPSRSYETVVNISDCYCGGDVFQLYANGQPYPAYSETSACSSSEDSQCSTYEEDPNECYDAPYWYCRRLYTFPFTAFPDPYLPLNLTIVPTRAPYGPGIGFVIFSQLSK